MRYFQILVLVNALLLPAHGSSLEKPSLIVVISLDQFPYDYLTRFAPYFKAGGFQRLMAQGANFTNATFKHATNVTAPGHATLLTGTYANQNGIIANNWFDRVTQKDVYCVADSTVTIVGGKGAGRSPRNLNVSTLGDELYARAGSGSKVISVSHKDRSAILMAGKKADGVFWMAESSFVSSSYYMKSFPRWVESFNNSGVVTSFFGKTWERVLPEEAYSGLDIDDPPYESDKDGMGRSFPHPIDGSDPSGITPAYYRALVTSPYSIEVLSAFAIAAIDGERLGQRGVPDVLCIGISTTDNVGHDYGPYSREVLEMAVHVDRVLNELLTTIEQKVGLSKCVVVLSSDHGVAPIPEYLHRHVPEIEAGRIRTFSLKEFCDNLLTRRFGDPGNGKSWIRRIVYGNIYLEREVVRAKGLRPERVAAVLADSLPSFGGIASAIAHQDAGGVMDTSIMGRVSRSFDAHRSGDVILVVKPFFIIRDEPTGADHDSPYRYDAHVPLIIMGQGVNPGVYPGDASPADIAPTLAELLGIPFPDGRAGRVLSEALISR